jgi:hypothetical protein
MMRPSDTQHPAPRPPAGAPAQSGREPAGQPALWQTEGHQADGTSTAYRWPPQGVGERDDGAPRSSRGFPDVEQGAGI